MVKCRNRLPCKWLNVAKRSCYARLPAKTPREPLHQGFQNSVDELRSLFPIWHIHIICFVKSIGFIIYCSLFWGTGLHQFDVAKRNEMTLATCSNPPSCYSSCSLLLFLSTCCIILREKEVSNIMLLLKCSLSCQVSRLRNMGSPRVFLSWAEGVSLQGFRIMLLKRGWTLATATIHAEAVSFLWLIGVCPVQWSHHPRGI